MKLLVLAGGLGTRVKKHIGEKPKALVDFNGRPFIYYFIKNYVDLGISSFIFCLNYKGKEIQEFIESCKFLNINFEFHYDGCKPLGTAGSIIKIIELLPNNFFITYGDTLLNIDFDLLTRKYEQLNTNALMTIYKNFNHLDKSNVKKISKYKIFYEKNNHDNEMNYIDYGLSVVNKKIFKKYDPNTVLDLSKIFFDLSIDNQLCGLEVSERFYEIGSINGIFDTKNFLMEKFNER